MAIEIKDGAAPEVREIATEITAASVDLHRVLQRAEVNATTWGRWARGAFDPRAKTLRKVREALREEIAARRDAAA